MWCKGIEQRFEFCDNSNSAKKLSKLLISIHDWIPSGPLILQNSKLPGQKWPTLIENDRRWSEITHGLMKNARVSSNWSKSTTQKWPEFLSNHNWWKFTNYVKIEKNGKIWGYYEHRKNHNAIFFQKIFNLKNPS